MIIRGVPIDPREGLRRFGAPEWYPQEAPKHKTNSTSTHDGNVVEFVCPECGYIRHDDVAARRSILVNKGDPWALHYSSFVEEVFNITNIEITKIEIRSSPPSLADQLFNFLNRNDEEA
ncbi:hypothetical protein A3D01_06440 [Candidatus Woesebacteria bacterium RIFCSPHIGHO2_02_FULL_39_13]|uniref:Uncharacterized protein n=1 Tax=Candidatus Woesebacteria bacterium RIFCSPHIGHO2_02_FULL_39_13 TaxID=1802505 RepID=A0A1F7Z5D3_9BACT|nr:MAG: hypothetical protein A3D01_06440 [Candidatus Woesebacteria bacterium RIFCSPHIGHO2_02_FULL_39_13]OGM71890.1 MAG: hypothetical protein A3H19_05435 [Candidatus Woesebacteria bacterium RIFCSPLOWO2_12_FULL_39_9]